MKPTILAASCVLLALSACVLDGTSDTNGNGKDKNPDDRGLDLPSASTFSCDDLDGSETACLDFNDDSAPGFQEEGGTWDTVNGRYVGWGPDATPGICTSSLMTHALVPDTSAQDLSVHAELASLTRVDKVIALRSADEGNRLQLNFRALDPDGNYGDLIVQEMRDCAKTQYTAENEVSIPHDLGEKIDVDIDLVGTHVTVRVNDDIVFDRDMPAIAVRSGQVGLGVIEQSVTMFDDLVIVSHDP